MDRARTTGPWALLPSRADWRAAQAHPRRDLVAGLTVAVVALPLALAFGVSSGLGAQAGLVTAVVAGALAAVFGGSNLQVSGPTGAMTVVLIPVVHRFGAQGVLTVGLLAGVILVLLAVARIGGLVRLLPMPVIEGFTAGIAVVIALQQLPAALGVDGGQHEHVPRGARGGRPPAPVGRGVPGQRQRDRARPGTRRSATHPSPRLRGALLLLRCTGTTTARL